MEGEIESEPLASKNIPAIVNRHLVRLSVLSSCEQTCAERDHASPFFRQTEASIQHMEEGKSVNKSMSLISRTEHLMQLPVMMSKNTLRVVKSRIGFHNFRHNNIQILNFNFNILPSHFFLFVECLIVHGRGDRIRAIGSEESPRHSQRTAG